jgi:hypothetical protein
MPSAKEQACNALVARDDERVKAGNTVWFDRHLRKGFSPFGAAGNDIVAIFESIL